MTQEYNFKDENPDTSRETSYPNPNNNLEQNLINSEKNDHPLKFLIPEDEIVPYTSDSEPSIDEETKSERERRKKKTKRINQIIRKRKEKL